MPHVALDVELGLLAVRRRGKGHVPVNARVCTGSNPADHTTLACCVSPLKNYDDPRPRSLNPPLQMSKLDLELRELLLKFLAAHFGGRGLFLSDAVLLFLVFYARRFPCASTHMMSTARPLIFPPFRSANTWLMLSSLVLWISALTLPSAANAIASARSSRLPTIEPRMVMRLRTTSKMGV